MENSIIGLVSASPVTTTSQFGLTSDHGPYISGEEIFIWALLLFLFLFSLFLFFKHIFTKRQNIIDHRQNYEFSCKLLKGVSILSLMIGFAGTLYSTILVLIRFSIMGEVTADIFAAYMFEELKILLVGLIISIISLFFYYLTQWKNVRAFSSNDSIQH